MKVKTSKGFTLAELLIVMAIIVVLAAVAIPTFGRQLETARETGDMELIRNAYTDALAIAVIDASDGYLDGAKGATGENVGTAFNVDSKVKASGTKETGLVYTVALADAITQRDTTFNYVNNTIAGKNVTITAKNDGFASFTFKMSDDGGVELTTAVTATALPT